MATWISATIYCSDPVATGAFYGLFGIPVRTIGDWVVEVSPTGGPVLQLVKSNVPSRTYVGVRVSNMDAAERGLIGSGIWCERRHPGVLICRDPDGNGVYALLPRSERTSQQIIIWTAFIRDVPRTEGWFRRCLGMSTTNSGDRIVVIGDPPRTQTDDVWVHFGDQPSMLLHPAGDKAVTEAELTIKVAPLSAVIDRLRILRWDYEFADAMTLVTRSPDNWLIRLSQLDPYERLTDKRKGELP